MFCPNHHPVFQHKLRPNGRGTDLKCPICHENFTNEGQPTSYEDKETTPRNGSEWLEEMEENWFGF
jgi:hypothetical protein